MVGSFVATVLPVVVMYVLPLRNQQVCVSHSLLTLLRLEEPNLIGLTGAILHMNYDKSGGQAQI